MSWRYTESGDDRLESAIGAFLSDVADRARRLPGLEALLLGGSLGRGEGTVERTQAGDRLASDVELYLVGRPSSLRDAARTLEGELAGNAIGEVSAAWLHPEVLASGRGKNLSWKPSRTIRLYELAGGSRVLVGVMPSIRPINAASLPLAEGVRLVMNRLAEAAPLAAEGTAHAARWLDKILIAAGDTILLADGRYAVRYRERVTRLAGADPPWPMPDGWMAEIAAAYERKVAGSAQTGSVAALSAVDDIVVALLRGAVPRVAGTALDPLDTFVPRYVVGGARNSELLRYLPPFGPRATYEALVLLARAVRAGHRPTARGLRQALLGRPRSLVLQAAAVPLFLGIARDDGSLISVAANGLDWGGVTAGDRGHSGPASLAQLLVAHWSVAT